MTAQLTERWGDIAWARPWSVAPYVGMSIYSGPAFPGLEWIRRWNVPVILGYESTEERAYSGEAGGRVDARQLISVARTLPGYVEAGCSFWMCAADRSRTPAWALPQITGYFRVATLEILDSGWAPARGFGYGNRDAALAATDGIVAAGVAGDEWGVGTWLYGEGSWPNALPAESDAALLQSGNTPGLVDGTDCNAMYQPLSYFAAYGGPAAEPEPVVIPTQPDDEEDSMRYLVTSDGGHAKKNDIVCTDGDSIWVGFRAGEWDPFTNNPLAHCSWMPMSGEHIDEVWHDKDRTRNYVAA